jgi:hypothetical protein
MTNDTKRRVGKICIYVSIPLLVAAICGMLFVKPEPLWSKLSLRLGFPLGIIGILLGSWAKRTG